MESGETGTPTKAAKLSTAQEQQASYPEWTAAYQAYYNSGVPPPHNYFPSSVAPGPQPPPYMWGPQPILPPYGTPHPPYVAMYPHRGLHGHSAMSPGSHAYGQLGLLSPCATGEGSTATFAGGEAHGCKQIDSAKHSGPIQKLKGKLVKVGRHESKGCDTRKTNSSPGSGVFSRSSEESRSEGSSEGSEEDNAQNILQKRSSEEMTVDGGGSNDSLPAYSPQACALDKGNVAGGRAGTSGGVSKMSSDSSLSTNWVVGVQDYWSGSTRGSQGGQRTSASTSSLIVPTTSNAALTVTLGLEDVPQEIWLQDEREVKRQRRKQSNRESARRSRLRKQAECEELGTRVDALTVENMALRTELARLAEECKQLTTENASLLGQLQKPRKADAEMLLDDEGLGETYDLKADSGEKCDVEADPADFNETKLVMSSGGPRMQRCRAHDEDSCDSTGKVSSPLESSTSPEAGGAG